MNKNIDFLCDFDGNAEIYQNGLVQVNSVKSDTLKGGNSVVYFVFKYKIKYSLSNSYFVIRVYDPFIKKGKKILFPLDYINVVKEESMERYDE